jgi:hypothetical protein
MVSGLRLLIAALALFASACLPSRELKSCYQQSDCSGEQVCGPQGTCEPRPAADGGPGAADAAPTDRGGAAEAGGADAEAGSPDAAPGPDALPAPDAPEVDAAELDGGVIEDAGWTDADLDAGVVVDAGGPITFPYSPTELMPIAPPVYPWRPAQDCEVIVSGSNAAFNPRECLPSGVLGSTMFGTPVLHVASLTLDAQRTLTVRGDGPLIVAVYGDTDLSGRIVTEASPGPPFNGCDARPGVDSTQSTAAGGGGGGGLASAGGRGGNSAAMGGTGGSARPSPPRIIRGCSGADGGKRSTDTAPRPAGGLGGGGLQISAAGRLTVRSAAELLGAGQGGEGGILTRSGGAGGGSGGVFWLEARDLVLEAGARINVTGGGGGGGADGSTPGDPGDPGSSAAPLAGADGGDGNAGNSGGSGGHGVIPAFDGDRGSDTQDEAGGGGGGGSGWIILRPAVTCAGTGSILLGVIAAAGSCTF